MVILVHFHKFTKPSFNNKTKSLKLTKIKKINSKFIRSTDKRYDFYFKAFQFCTSIFFYKYCIFCVLKSFLNNGIVWQKCTFHFVWEMLFSSQSNSKKGIDLGRKKIVWKIMKKLFSWTIFVMLLLQLVFYKKYKKILKTMKNLLIVLWSWYRMKLIELNDSARS